MIFTVEYILRLWTCTINIRFKKPVIGRLGFAATPMSIIDLMAILPFYMPMLIFDLRFVRVLRLFRLFRLFKLGRYSESLKKFGNVLKSKREELGITVFIVTMLLIFASSVMYHFENEAQPVAFSSIPKAMWWSVATLTTVGYGDVYPVTNIGKLFGSIIAILGVGMVALPAGILASGFAEEIKNKEKGQIICPHCGKNIDGTP
jgi:voltage-gated potassium channel